MKQTAAWRFVCVRFTPAGVIEHFHVPLSLFQSDFKRKIFVTAISSIFSTNEETDRLGNLFSAGYLQVRELDPNAFSLRLHSFLKNVDGTFYSGIECLIYSFSLRDTQRLIKSFLVLLSSLCEQI